MGDVGEDGIKVGFGDVFDGFIKDAGVWDTVNGVGGEVLVGDCPGEEGGEVDVVVFEGFGGEGLAAAEEALTIRLGDGGDERISAEEGGKFFVGVVVIRDGMGG